MENKEIREKIAKVALDSYKFSSDYKKWFSQPIEGFDFARKSNFCITDETIYSLSTLDKVSLGINPEDYLTSVILQQLNSEAHTIGLRIQRQQRPKISINVDELITLIGMLKSDMVVILSPEILAWIEDRKDVITDYPDPSIIHSFYDFYVGKINGIEIFRNPYIQSDTVHITPLHYVTYELEAEHTEDITYFNMDMKVVIANALVFSVDDLPVYNFSQNIEK